MVAHEERRVSAVGKIQAELAFLSRTTEHFARRSDLYTDLERSWFIIAQVLEEFGEFSVSGLAIQLALDGTTVTRQVAAMEKRGLLARTHHPNDGRTRILTLTPRGLDLLVHLRAERTRRYGETFEDWTDEELNILSMLVGKLNESIISGANLNHGRFGPTQSNGGTAS